MPEDKLESRPDRKNLETFLAHGKRVSYGTSVVIITWHEGYMAKWETKEVREGHQAPLEKGNGGNT